MKKIYEIFEEGLACSFFILIFLLLVVGVLLRFVFGISFAWNIELTRYSFVWLTFVGAAYARRTDSHIRIDLFYNFLKKKAPSWFFRVFWLFTKVIVIAFLFLMIYYSVTLSINSWRFKSQAMQMPQSFLYISVGLGALMFVGREIVDTIKKLSRGEF